MPISYRFRWIPFVAAMLAMALGIVLGNWQTGRAAQKEAIEATMAARTMATPLVLASGTPLPDPGTLEYRRVLAQGEFVREWTVYLENRPYQGVPGFYVLTPLRIAGSDRHLLVMRGWAPRNMADRTRVPEFSTPSGAASIRGVVRRDVGKLLQLGQPQPVKPGALLQNLDIGDFERASGLAMLPFVLEQNGDDADGLVRDWPRPSAGVDKHRGYAFQWYALAATALIFFIATGFRRASN
ncbi:MAG: SURF1 family protein [Noviherbaspirillum sp.]